MLRTALTKFGSRMTHCHRQQIQSILLRSQSTSATSALSFKNQRKQRRYGPITPTIKEPTVEDAVTNILYNTPTTDKDAAPTRHILSCLVQNEPGVLSRLSGVLAARDFNIESLVVANTEVPDLSRMTVVFKGQHAQIEQARRQLEDMVPVWAVLDYTGTRLVERELLLVKVSILGPEHLHEQMPTTKFDRDTVFMEDELNDHKVDSPSSSSLSSSENLRATFSHLRALTELTRLFDGKVVDVSSDSVVVELCTKPNRIDSFIKLCRPFGILEASRTGVMAMPRAPVHDHSSLTNDTDQDEADAVDATMLPPG